MVQVQDLDNTIGSRNVSWSVRCNGALGVVETSRHSSWGYHNRIDVVGAVGKVVVEASKKKRRYFLPEISGPVLTLGTGVLF